MYRQVVGQEADTGGTASLSALCIPKERRHHDVLYTLTYNLYPVQRQREDRDSERLVSILSGRRGVFFSLYHIDTTRICRVASVLNYKIA